MKTDSQLLLEQIKEATMEIHQQFEKLPFFSALFKRKLSIESYIYQLKSLAIVFRAFEQQLKLVEHSTVKDILMDYQPRLPFILNDLKFLATEQHLDNLQLISKALEFESSVINRVLSCPIAIVGYYYVLEGSQLGGQVLKPHYAESFNLGEKGLSFLTSHPVDLQMKWKTFGNKLNKMDLSIEERHAIINGARECFLRLFEIYEILPH